MKVVISAAGTGGHINPGLAIANKIMEKEDLEAIAKVIIENDIYVLSDEIYAELTYTVNPASLTASIMARRFGHHINSFHILSKITASTSLMNTLLRKWLSLSSISQ